MKYLNVYIVKINIMSWMTFNFDTMIPLVLWSYTIVIIILFILSQIGIGKVKENGGIKESPIWFTIYILSTIWFVINGFFSLILNDTFIFPNTQWDEYITLFGSLLMLLSIYGLIRYTDSSSDGTWKYVGSMGIIYSISVLSITVLGIYGTDEILIFWSLPFIFIAIGIGIALHSVIDVSEGIINIDENNNIGASAVMGFVSMIFILIIFAFGKNNVNSLSNTDNIIAMTLIVVGSLGTIGSIKKNTKINKIGKKYCNGGHIQEKQCKPFISNYCKNINPDDPFCRTDF